MRNFAAIAIAAAAGILGGCASTSSLTTAKPLPKGKGRFYLAGGATTVTDPEGSDPSRLLTLPYIELMYRHGVYERLELGLKYTLPFTLGLDAKLNLINADVFALSIGGYAGYMRFVSGSASLTIVDLAVPVYVSIHPTSWLAIYAVPKYMDRIITAQLGSSSSSLSAGSSVGGTGGVQLGNTSGLIGEYTYLKFRERDDKITQVAVALFFGMH